MSTVATQPAFALTIPKSTLWSRYLAWRETPRPLTVESILSAAEQGQLDAHLTNHYTIYYDANWIDNLQLCRDLVEGGLLKAEFTDDYEGTPIFLKKDARITVAGREHLAKLRQTHFRRRFRGWAIASATAIGIALIGAYLKSWIGLK